MTPFKPGDTGRTRDGRDYEVLAVDDDPNFPLFVAVAGFGSTWYLASGAWQPKGEYGLDLLPPTRSE